MSFSVGKIIHELPLKQLYSISLNSTHLSGWLERGTRSVVLERFPLCEENCPIQGIKLD